MTSFTIDFSKPTCRVCLQNSQDEEMSSIFDVDSEFDDLHIYEKIEQCADIKIIRHDKIPTLICGDCYGYLIVSYKFRTICRNSNEYLKELFVSGKSTPLQLEESSPNDKPVLIEKKRGKITQYKTRRKKRILSPVVETIKSEHELAVRNENDSIDFEALNVRDAVGVGESEHLDDENNDVCLDPDYQDDDFDVRREADEFEDISKKRNKSSKKTKKARTEPSKTLDISSDGAAIIRAKRVQKERLPHICEICGNKYPHRYALEMHMRRHRNEKPYACEICSYSFHRNFELIRHMRRHTGSRPYKCSYCPRAFGDQSTLIKHERIHRNERPFKCNTCGKTFTYSGVLNYHMLTHTGEKPYACEICGKTFSRTHHLRAHLETLQHQNDPKAKMQLANIKKNNISK
ncbi:transcription factor Ouib-like [Lucilia sericata]|uniref:transcription factor Ouib-like n=1 Tax=Lucilia sericata TaxID=13632 RepID=UPI0018A7F68A|nr:transcription factor Ouib-like [Lucilia sericata]